MMVAGLCRARVGENQASAGLIRLRKARWALTNSGPVKDGCCHMPPRLRHVLGATEVQSSGEESKIWSTRR